MFSKPDIEKYFMAEKQESLLFLIIGIIALILAIAFFFFLKTNFYKGAAIPLVLIGLIQIVVGYTVYKRSDEDRVRNVYAYDMNPGQLKNEELRRMKTVIKKFAIYRWVEIVCVLGGALLIFYCKNNPDKALCYGLGVTLVVQAALMVGADYFSEKRAVQYSKGIESFVENPHR
jgi:ABC-type xylose transport system permease subunit